MGEISQGRLLDTSYPGGFLGHRPSDEAIRLAETAARLRIYSRPIIDVNIQTAFSLYGPVGVLTRPLTIVLLVLLVLTAFVFTRFMARAERPTRLEDALSANDPPKTEAVKKQFSISSGMSKAWPPLLLMAGAALALQTSLDYPPRARMLPLGLSVGIIALSAMEIFKQMFRTETGPQQIMNLGMRSRGMGGASHAGWLLAGLFALFLFLMMTIRLDNAAIAFAVLVPLLFLSGWQHWLTAAITGGILAAWTYGFMNYFMAVIWPEPVLAGWLLELFGLRL